MAGRAVTHEPASAAAASGLVELTTPELRDGFAREVADINRRRLRLIGPIMVLVHVAHVAVFRYVATHEDSLTETALRTLDVLSLNHCAMVLLTGFLTVLVFRSQNRLVGAVMGPLVATLYLVHGATCTAVALTAVQSVTTYVGYSLGMAVILCISPRAAVVAYSIGLLSLIASLLIVVPTAQTFLTTMPTCATITAVGVALASLF